MSFEKKKNEWHTSTQEPTNFDVVRRQTYTEWCKPVKLKMPMTQFDEIILGIFMFFTRLRIEYNPLRTLFQILSMALVDGRVAKVVSRLAVEYGVQSICPVTCSVYTGLGSVAFTAGAQQLRFLDL